jgi:hypothetical protein
MATSQPSMPSAAKGVGMAVMQMVRSCAIQVAPLGLSGP